MVTVPRNDLTSYKIHEKGFFVAAFGCK